jgi:glutamate/tyrosine decarboxylase-like PLP-dependent enzyme
MQNYFVQDNVNFLCCLFSLDTVNTDAFNNLLELSFLADSNNMWFHVDNLFIGSLVILDSEGRHHMSHIEKSDALTFNLHKRLYCPHETECILIRDTNYLKSIFSLNLKRILSTFFDF